MLYIPSYPYVEITTVSAPLNPMVGDFNYQQDSFTVAVEWTYPDSDPTPDEFTVLVSTSGSTTTQTVPGNETSVALTLFYNVDYTVYIKNTSLALFRQQHTANNSAKSAPSTTASMTTITIVQETHMRLPLCTATKTLLTYQPSFVLIISTHTHTHTHTLYPPPHVHTPPPSPHTCTCLPLPRNLWMLRSTVTLRMIQTKRATPVAGEAGGRGPKRNCGRLRSNLYYRAEMLL